MTEEKAKKMIVATTVGAVLLLVTLLAIMVYQIISIKVKENKIAYLQTQIERYEHLKNKGEETLEIRSMREWIEKEARKLGYTYSV